MIKNKILIEQLIELNKKMEQSEKEMNKLKAQKFDIKLEIVILEGIIENKNENLKVQGTKFDK